jgi:PAS domain S-box-containing protein
MQQRTMLRDLMSRAASAGSLDEVYQSALRCVQHALGIDRASLLLFDASDTMRFVAWSGLSEEYRRAVDGHSPWSRNETDADPILVSDVERDVAVAAYRPIMTKEGVRALAFIPLQFGANLLGKFMLYYREPHEFTAVEIATAEKIADYVVFALEHHRIAVALEDQLDSERDLRHRAELEAARRLESENRLHVALGAGQMAAWEWDLATNRIKWSEEGQRMFGLQPDFPGTLESFLAFVHPADVARMGNIRQQIESAPDRDSEWEFRITRPDGTVRWISSRGRLIVDRDGKPSRVVGVSTDVTNAKRLAEAAREADRRKDDFLATLAHELRNPLAAVRIGVAVIRKADGHPQTIAEHCTVLERQLRHLTRLVDDLLDVADITRRGLPMEKANIELSGVVSVALEQCRDLVEEAGHELTVRLPAEPVALEADPQRMVQVLANLLSNAVKYTPRGGRITVSAERQGAEVRLSVKDSGLGIPTDKLESVFEMFSQLDRSLETGHKGLGIGLALVRALVSMHGGRITAHSDGLGAGSEFNVWLPIAPIEVDAALPEQKDDRRESAGCRVLVVDDNQDLVKATSRLLRVLGHDVRVAFNGAEAIEVADQFRPDIVLLDIAMPKVNGYEVARTIRGSPWGREMTLVAVTGWGQEDDQRRSVDAGFDLHMTKPVDPLVLEAFLDSIAKRHVAPPRMPLRSPTGATAEAVL